MTTVGHLKDDLFFVVDDNAIEADRPGINARIKFL